MEETLKSVRLLHQLLIALSATLLAFALTPNEASALRTALSELYSLRDLDTSSYVDWISEQLTSQENRQPVTGFAARVALELGIPLGKEFRYSPAVYVGLPERAAPLRDWEMFFRRPAVGTLEPSLLELHLKSVRITGAETLTELSVVLSRDDSIPIPRSSPAGSAARTKALTKPGDFTMVMSQGTDPAASSSTVSMPLFSAASRNLDWAVRWVAENPPLSEKLFSVPSYGLEGFVDTERVSFYERPPIFLPGAHQYWQQLGHLPVADAIDKLEKRAENTTQTLTLFSISIQEGLLRWVGPITTLFFLLYLAVHLRHLQTIAQNGTAELQTFPWIGFFRGGISAILRGLTLFLLPLLANGFLLWRTGSGISRLGTLVLIISMLLVVQVYILKTSSRIRGLIPPSLVRAEPT